MELLKSVNYINDRSFFLYTMMKIINETFLEEEFNELKAKKGQMTWREFILYSANVKKRS